MKRNSNLFVVSASCAAVGLLLSANVFASELSVQTAQAVSSAKAEQRAELAKSLVNRAISGTPADTLAVVSAVAKSTPEVAPIVAVAAATAQPAQIGAITKAAVTAAPAQASQIVAALCEKFPTSSSLVVLSATEAAPATGKEIVAAARSATVIGNTLKVASAATPAVNSPMPAPSVGAPFTTVTGGVVEKSRTDTSIVTPGGGRTDYSGM
ncbi:MAG: hypothetical protein RLZZ350_2089 [Verrucomicrobiota bacterium]|jgi:hypothetical protein